MWDAILNFIFFCVEAFYKLTGDWGIAIICVTICFRILVFPITRKQYKSTYAMQKISPKLKELQARYANDKQKLQEETMKLYKEANFNPLTSCLPMILQMPIFIALFQVLQRLGGPDGFIAMAGYPSDQPATFLGLVPDLSTSTQTIFTLVTNPADTAAYENLTQASQTLFASQGILALIPYILLILLFGVSILIPTLLNKNTEKQAKIMTLVMTAFMFYIGWISPAGVLLYWNFSSYIGVGQQIATMRMLKKKDERIESEKETSSQPTDIVVQRTEKKSKPVKKKKK